MIEYSSIKEVVSKIISMSGGKRKVIDFEKQNKYWIFTLDTGTRIKLLAI